MKLTWLSESSRLIACRKMDCMSLNVAYPDVWFDEFKGIKIDSEQFLLNVLTIMKNQTIYQIEKLKHQKKDTYWDSACFDVNAYYYSELNMFCIPIGFLFPPFYGDDMNFIQNIAGLGNIVGHEISHGFDKDGRKYDEFGNNYPWWTSLDVELYKEKTQKIIKLFNDASYHGLKVNGALTLDENLADFGALAITLDVLRAYFATKSLTKEERKSQLQEFFIWYSKTWCYKATRAKKDTAIKVNVHAPPELRVNALLPHFDEFYEAFDFDESYEGFIPKSERIDVWG
jgi:predicted metalloendopeptidase